MSNWMDLFVVAVQLEYNIKCIDIQKLLNFSWQARKLLSIEDTKKSSRAAWFDALELAIGNIVHRLLYFVPQNGRTSLV